MKALYNKDIQDPKLRNAVIIARDAHNRGISFSKAIQDAAKFCKVDAGEVTNRLLEIVKEKQNKQGEIEWKKI